MIKPAAHVEECTVRLSYFAVYPTVIKMSFYIIKVKGSHLKLKYDIQQLFVSVLIQRVKKPLNRLHGEINIFMTFSKMGLHLSLCVMDEGVGSL